MSRTPIGVDAPTVTPASGDFLVGFDASNKNEPIKDTAANWLTAALNGATIAELNSAADVSGRLVNTGDVDTHVLLTTDSGKTHVIPNVTGDIAITLPTPAAGLEYPIVFGGTAAEGDNWVITATSDFIGGLTQVDTDGSAAAVAADGSSKNTCTVIDPLAGTNINMISDGTNWFISGMVCSATPPTFTDV